MTSRCIKCGGNHESRKCTHNLNPNDPRSRIPQKLVKCANCRGPHTANYTECPAKIKYINIRNLARNKHKPNDVARITLNKNSNTLIENKTQYKSHDNVSFLQNDVSDRPSTSKQRSYAKVLQQDHSTNDLLDPSECYQMFKQFMNAILKCKTKADQIDTIAQLSLNFAAQYDVYR